MAQVGKGQTQTLGMCHPVPPVLILKDSSNGGGVEEKQACIKGEGQ